MPTSDPDRSADKLFDVAVLGAGPAGLASAATAAEAGAQVALIDAAPRAGGQYWGHREGDDGSHHTDWSSFTRLRRACRITPTASSSYAGTRSGRSKPLLDKVSG